MIKPTEIEADFPVDIGQGKIVQSEMVWQTLLAAYHGDLSAIKRLLSSEPALAWAQYNYMPPIHLAVREGHEQVVEFLLSVGAHDPSYRSYPFRDDLLTIAIERGFVQIADRLRRYAADPRLQRFSGDNGAIKYPRTNTEQKFEDAVDHNDLAKVTDMLRVDPSLAGKAHYFWGEGILMMPAKNPDIPMLELLLAHGAKIPPVLKWIQAYYFETYAGADFMLNHGMNADAMSCHRVTILHDMAQKGNLEKANLLLKHGASLDLIEEEYQSTPLGIAARWGHVNTVRLLVAAGADPNKAGAIWAKPLAWAVSKQHLEITVMLKRAGASL